jgi:hypothetical protein
MLQNALSLIDIKRKSNTTFVGVEFGFGICAI